MNKQLFGTTCFRKKLDGVQFNECHLLAAVKFEKM